jgi:hypothetical protein
VRTRVTISICFISAMIALPTVADQPELDLDVPLLGDGERKTRHSPLGIPEGKTFHLHRYLKQEASAANDAEEGTEPGAWAVEREVHVKANGGSCVATARVKASGTDISVSSAVSVKAGNGEDEGQCRSRVGR